MARNSHNYPVGGFAELQVVETALSEERAPVVCPTATWSSAWVTPLRQLSSAEMSNPPKKRPRSVEEMAAFEVAREAWVWAMDVPNPRTSAAVDLI
jgi:hypothetical protein